MEENLLSGLSRVDREPLYREISEDEGCQGTAARAGRSARSLPGGGAGNSGGGWGEVFKAH